MPEKLLESWCRMKRSSSATSNNSDRLFNYAFSIVSAKKDSLIINKKAKAILMSYFPDCALVSREAVKKAEMIKSFHLTEPYSTSREDGTIYYEILKHVDLHGSYDLKKDRFFDIYKENAIKQLSAPHVNILNASPDFSVATKGDNFDEYYSWAEAAVNFMSNITNSEEDLIKLEQQYFKNNKFLTKHKETLEERIAGLASQIQKAAEFLTEVSRVSYRTEKNIKKDIISKFNKILNGKLKDPAFKVLDFQGQRYYMINKFYDIIKELDPHNVLNVNHYAKSMMDKEVTIMKYFKDAWTSLNEKLIQNSSY